MKNHVLATRGLVAERRIEDLSVAHLCAEAGQLVIEYSLLYIEHGNVVALLQQEPYEVTAGETGSSGDERFHGFPPGRIAVNRVLPASPRLARRLARIFETVELFDNKCLIFLNL